MNVSAISNSSFKSNISHKAFTGETYIPVNYSHHHNIPYQLVITILTLISLIDLVGNSIVVAVIVLQCKMQTFTNWMIFNLAIADLAVALFCIPLEIPLEIIPKWIYGDFFCVIFYPIQTATIYASVFTLVVLSCSRYYGIVHPFRSQPRRFHAKLFIILIWVLSFLCVTPYMAAMKVNKENGYCEDVWTNSQKRSFTLVTFVIQFVLPLTIITTAYSFIIYEVTFKRRPMLSNCVEEKIRKQNKNLSKLVLVVTVTFAVCVLPYHVIAMFVAFGNAGTFKYISVINIMSFFVLYLNSALNPVLYNMYSSNFREAFVALYAKLSRCSPGVNKETECCHEGHVSKRKRSQRSLVNIQDSSKGASEELKKYVEVNGDLPLARLPPKLSLLANF